MDNKKRCKWCNMKNSLYIKYHDEDIRVFSSWTFLGVCTK